MAINKTGIAITIKAFLPIGKTLDEQLTALTMVKEAHETGDYAAVLKAAIVDEVKSEQKTRRFEEEPATTTDPETGRTEVVEDPHVVGERDINGAPIDDDFEYDFTPPEAEDDEFGGAPIDNEFGEDDVIPSGAAG